MIVATVVISLVALIPGLMLIPLLLMMRRAGKPVLWTEVVVGVWITYTVVRLAALFLWPDIPYKLWAIVALVMFLGSAAITAQYLKITRRRSAAVAQCMVPCAEVNAIITYPGQPDLISPFNGDLTVEQVRSMAAQYRDQKAAVAGHDGIHVGLHGERWRYVARTLAEQADDLDALADRYDQPSTVAAGKE